jgi:5'-3' exonuclease
MIALIDGDVLIYQSLWGSTSLKDCITKLEELITNCIESTFSDDYLIAVGSPKNFRDILYPEYKQTAGRVKARQNKSEYFDDLKEYLITKENTVQAIGFEADDLLRIWSEQANEPFIVCSVDKDLKCISGLHWDLRKQVVDKVDKDRANSFYWKQILMGDPVDNIPGIERVGPKTAERILEGLTTDEQRKEVVISKYKEVYGELWESHLLMNGRLIHLWRFEHDYFTI